LILDRYRLQRQLGAGGFGTVWMARDERLEREVAVKLLPRVRVSPGRFEREARAAARLSHPAIVTLYEAATDEDGAYLVSELVRGPTLERALSAGRLSDRAILDIGVTLCEALEHAHGEGVVHRDVKPSNILLPARTSGPPAKLTDFGIARVVGGDTLTRTGELVGTAAYMAPEQAAGREAGEAADLYSLALVLYEALTGINPAAHLDARRRLALFMPPLRRQRRDLPRELGQAIDLALRPRPSERGTLGELRAGLEAAAEQASDRTGVIEPPWLGEEAPPRDQISQRPVRAPRPAARAWLPGRAAAAATTAALVAWTSLHLLNIPPAPATAAAALVVLLLPRLGWLALTVPAASALAGLGHPGYALLLAGIALSPALLLPRRGHLWPLPALAPALGLAAGLAGAWPALAGRAGSVYRRAVLGALGWSALQLAGSLVGHGLFLHLAASDPGWSHSLHTTVGQILRPLATPEVVAGAGVWAAAAALLPAIRTRGSRLADAWALVAWGAGLVAATAALFPGAAGPAAIGALVGILSALP
jgi:serine/threonine protein kinase